jgi:hypothetical protein
MTIAGAVDDDDNKNNSIYLQFQVQEPNMITYEPSCILWFPYKLALPK